ncbi:glycosyltransferase [Litorihabitans aurantiacus]|uniref:Colanic acid biosynthesis glycosyltransferase WcaL n=1 Tax=Litorihabitans aurantiacus TaxID=1930061 RepID=A0AA37XI12_9MICO|nr:glycosyltransferase [Litorihabitans aurantiacus]GMA33454.1 colanic acid biosynthesis glycosyltransferase WcaL [Litorihabitans aurantiacus]
MRDATTARPRIGYVLKMYPRFSETFVVTEILAREAAGAAIEIFSLRAPVDPRFHDSLARVQAPVRYVPRVRRADDLWSALAEAREVLGPLPDALVRDLLAAEAEDAAQALAVAVAARRSGLTHLHAHFASLATTVARLAAAAAGLTYSFTAHAKDLFHEQVDDADVLRKAADAHHVVTISEYNVAHLRGLGVDASRLHLVYNGLDLDAFTPREDAGREGDGELHVVAVGRLVEKKGFTHLLDAVALLRRGHGVAARLTLVGGGELDGELRARAAGLGLGDAVTFTGPLPQAAVRDVVAGADVLAAPCVVGADGNADGLPTVVLEAMALGTPCVTTAVTGLGEAIAHERTGLVVGQHDAAGLAAALERLHRDPALARRLRAEARRLVEERFDARRQAAALQALLPSEPFEKEAVA